MEEANEIDFNITKVDLGPSSVKGDVHNFQNFAVNIIERTKKEKK